MLKAMGVGILATWGTIGAMALIAVGVNAAPLTSFAITATMAGAGLGALAFGGRYR